MPTLGTQNEPVVNPTAYGFEREPDKFTFPCHPYLGRLALSALAVPGPSVCMLLSVAGQL